MKMGRRKFVALGVTGLGSFSLMSLTSCTARLTQSVESEGTASDAQVEELERATIDWQTAFALAEENWDDLQFVIDDSESAIEALRTKIVTNPEALTEFESSYQEAKGVKNQHEDMIMPAELTEIQDSIEDLEGIAKTYQQAIDEMYDCRSKVEIFDPFKGEFDITNSNGYSYQIKYELVGKATASVDTTEGAPGMLEVTINAPTALNLTITNTTPGKKAPIPDLGTFGLVRAAGQISGFFNRIYPDGYNRYLPDNYGGKHPQVWLADVVYTYANPPAGGADLSNPDLQTGLQEYGEGPIYEYHTIGGQWNVGTRLFGSGSGELGVGESAERGPSMAERTGAYTYTYIIPEDDKDAFIKAFTENIVGIVFYGGDRFGVVGFIDGTFTEPIMYISAP